MSAATAVAAPLRVLQVIETGGPGGAETVFADLSAGLRERGHTVQCLVAPGSWLPDTLRERGLSVEPLVSGGAFDVALLRSLIALIRRERIELVHAHLFEGALYAAMAAQLARIPSVATLHGQVDVARGGWRSAIKRRIFGASIGAVVTVSDALRRDLAPVLPLPAHRLLVVPNGVAMRPWSSVSPRTAAQRTARLIAVGNIRAPKNYPLLLEAVALLRQSVPTVHLDVLGEPDPGGLFAALQAQVEALGLHGAVTFHGFVADPTPLLMQADAFVLASSQEGFSLATIEAMQAGVPVVATRSGGPEEILRHGETGLLVPVNDAVALADAIGQVLRDTALAERLTAAARDDAVRRFSLDSMVSAYEQLYRRLLQPPALANG